MSYLKLNSLRIFQEKKIVKVNPPVQPELYKKKYLLSKNNNNYEIPNAFYNHLMMKEYNSNITYIKSSITKRNKAKLLTIIYYRPKIKG